MNLNSLITKILFVFSISLVLFIGVFIGNYYYEQNKLNTKIGDNYKQISKYIRDYRLNPPEIIEYVEKLDLKIIEDRRSIRPLLDNVIPIAGPGFDYFEYKGEYYVHLFTPRARILFKDLKEYSFEYFSFIVLGTIFIIYFLSFLWIIRALKPLKVLKEEIKSFSNGNLDINCKSDKKDEIAEVANEFDNAVQKISLLINSRQLFLRTVMHELKTPIAKGRIVSELVDDEKQKDRMILIFDKLNYLVNNFSKVEEIVSKNYKINKYSTKIDLIIENSLDMMLLDNPKNKVEVEDISKRVLNVDLELFSLAVKNLLDNGIKYSEDKKVIIQEKDNALHIISKGEELEKPLEDYFKAYHNETKSKNHGMGLGLYIVHEILKMHEMNLEYEYLNNNNIFKITF